MISSLDLAAPPPRVLRARIAVSIAFLLLGLGMGLWAVHIPLVQARLGIDPAVLGLALFTFAVGAVLSMPVSGWAIGRFGSRAPTGAIMIWFTLTMSLPLLAGSELLFFIAVFAFGTAMGSLDVAANVQASEIEAARGQPTMSSFHGFYAVGGLAGALLAAAIVERGWGDGTGAAIVAGLFCVVAFLARRHLLPSERPIAGGPRFALPSRRVLWTGILAFLCFASEGAITDWSALFLTTVRGATPAAASIGFAVFAGAMAICRLFGDPVVARLGPKNILVGGGLLIALGIGLAIATPSLVISAAGFGLVGIGAANVVPVLFSEAGRTPPSGANVAAVTTLGYTGFLVMPVILGFVANSAGLTTSLMIVLLMGLAILILSLRR